MSTNDARTTRSPLSSVLPDRVADRVAGWTRAVSDGDGDADRLFPLLSHPDAAAFLVAAADGVLRPEGQAAAAAALHRLSGAVPAGLPWLVRGTLQLGAAVAPVLPAPTVALARRGVRDLLAGLAIDARPDRLGPALENLRAAGGRPDLRLSGAAVLGDAAARRRVDGIRALLARDDVDRVSFSLADVVPRLTPWAFDSLVERAAERVLPVFLDAAARGSHVTLVVDGRGDLDLAVAVLTRVLEEPRLEGLEAGIALPVAVADAVAALRELGAWARQRAADGGGRLRVRLVDGVPVTDELAEAARQGWNAPFAIDRADVDALAVAAIREALDARTGRALEVELVTADPVVAALARELADAAESTLGIVVPLVAAPALGRALADDGAAPVVCAPVVQPEDADVVAAALVHAATEAVLVPEASPRADAVAERSPSDESETADDDETAPAVSPTRERVERALARADRPVVPARSPRRAVPAEPSILRDRPDDDAAEAGLTQAVLGIAREAAASGDTSALGPDVQQMLFGGQAFVDTAVFAVREGTEAAVGAAGFRNASATDASVPEDRAWARAVLDRVDGSVAGDATAAAGRVDDAAGLDAVLARVREGAEPWGALAAADRAAVLSAAVRTLEDRRAELIEVLASEAGVLVADADAEVGAAVDAAAYYAVTAKELDRVPGAVFVPDRATVVAPRWNAPVGLCAAETLAALATGSGVVLTPSPRARRSGAVVAEALWAAGVPRDVLAYVDLNEEASGRSLIVHPGVDRVLVGGARSTAERFAAWRPDLALQGLTAGRNAVIVAPSADLDAAVADLVAGAFARAGQAPTASSLVILVGSIGRSARFADQLKDAVSSLRVGPADDPRSDVGPLVDEPSGDVRRALTVLEDGERWLVPPRELDLGPDTAGRFWTPGVRVGVNPGSHLARAAIAAPVLSVLTAPTLARAVEMQNLVGSGFVAGLHTRDAADLDLWLDTVEAGVLRVNRVTTGAAAQREPLGGWGEAAVGPTAMSGGPNRLVALGSWRPSSGGPSSTTLHLRGLDSRISGLIEAAQPTLDYGSFEWLRRGALSDAVAWDREFGRVKDVSRLGVERNLWRYRPADVAVRATGDAAWQAVLRVVVAAVRSGSRFTLSSPVGLPAEVRHLLGEGGVAVSVESDVEWLERLAGGIPDAVDAVGAARAGGRPSRVRLVGPPATVARLRAALAETIAGDPAVAVYADEVTTAGRIELLPFLREQAVSIAAFRGGRPDPWSAEVV